MSKLTEKLGIKPIEEVELWVKKGRWCAASKVRKVEQQNADMLEALRKITKRCEASTFDEWSLKAIVDIGRESIEKATGKKWDEIKEKDNE